MTFGRKCSTPGCKNAAACGEKYCTDCTIERMQQVERERHETYAGIIYRDNGSTVSITAIIENKDVV